ncbi:MAG: response regulator [Oscillospiraceae bacterium]
MAENYKIMIVDDEKEVREGIAKKIHWGELGFEVVATAENGEDALEKAESIDLDVVLTDIKMPFMDGLTFGSKLKVLYPNVKMIILTGFDEFEFAKQAISLNVVEYILKPVNELELNEILRRVKNTLDADIASKRNIENMRRNYEKSRPLLRERFINELLWGMIPRSEIEANIETFKLPFIKGRQKNVTAFDIDVKNSKSGIEYELIPISVKQIVDSHCDGKCMYETFISSKVVVAITEWDSKNPIGEVMALANEICDECKRVLDLKVTAGVGRCCDSVSRLSMAYADAVSALEYKAVVGTGSVIYIRDMEMSSEIEPTIFDNTKERNLTSAVKFGSHELIKSTIDEILGHVGEKTVNEWEFQSSLISIFSCIVHLIQRAGLEEGTILGSDANRFFSISSDFSIEDLKAWLVGVCLRMNELMSEKRVTTEEKIISGAKEYISQNYQNSNMSVEVMCEHLHISQSYFSALFKKVTSQTYVNYLTEIRLQKALELLEHTEEKTYFIANSVGYDEPNYFSYVFKKRFGISPSQYRIQHQNNGAEQ